MILVLGGLLAAGPVLAARTFDAAAPVETRPPSGSDRITEIVRQIRMVEAQARTTQTQVTTLTQRRARVLQELEAARTLEKALGADVKAARAAAAAAIESRDAARTALAELTRARTAAQEEYEAAQRALSEAQERLESVSAAADRADDALTRATNRLEDAKSGSKAHGAAVSTWTMAAIDERAAHARQVLADDRAADQFVGLQAAEAVLAEVDYSYQEATSARTRADRAAEQATARVAELKAERAAVKAQVAALEPEAKQLRSAVKAAEKRLATLTTQLEGLRQSAATAGQQLAAAGAVHVAPAAADAVVAIDATRRHPVRLWVPGGSPA